MTQEVGLWSGCSLPWPRVGSKIATSWNYWPRVVVPDSTAPTLANLTLPWSRNGRNLLTREVFSGRSPRILGFPWGGLLAIVAAVAMLKPVPFELVAGMRRGLNDYPYIMT